MKSYKSSEPLKQAKLSFASKRTTSANSSAGKPTVAKWSSRTSSRHASPGIIVLTDSEEESEDDASSPVPILKKRRLDRRAKRPVTEEHSLQPPIEVKEPLNVSDKRWRKLYGVAREKMGNIDPGEWRA